MFQFTLSFILLTVVFAATPQNDPRLRHMHRDRFENMHSEGWDSQWAPPHPHLVLPSGPGFLDTPEVQAFLSNKYQCRRYEWAPTFEECRALLDVLPDELPCGDKRVILGRSEDRPSAGGGTNAGGCEIEIFDSDPSQGTCWTKAEIVNIVEGMISVCGYDDEFGTVYDDMRVMGTYYDTLKFRHEVRWKQLSVQPSGIKIFNEDRFVTFPKNGGIYRPGVLPVDPAAAIGFPVVKPAAAAVEDAAVLDTTGAVITGGAVDGTSDAASTSAPSTDVSSGAAADVHVVAPLVPSAAEVASVSASSEAPIVAPSVPSATKGVVGVDSPLASGVLYSREFKIAAAVNADENTFDPAQIPEEVSVEKAVPTPTFEVRKPRRMHF